MGGKFQKLCGIDHHLGPQLDLHLPRGSISGRSRTSILGLVTLICDDCEEDLDITTMSVPNNDIKEMFCAVESCLSTFIS